MGEKSTFALREDDMPEPLPVDQDVTAQQLVDELTQAIQGELLEMVRLLEGTDPASLFGLTEFKIRDLALQVAAKAYPQRLEQKKRLRRVQRDLPPLPADRQLSRRP